LVRLDLDSNIINKNYFCYYFDLSFARLQIEYIGKGAAQNNLNNEEISSIKIPVPQKSVQHRIISILEQARSSKKQKEAEAERLLASIDNYMLQELGIELPEAKHQMCFKVSASEIRGKRADPNYHSPFFQKLFNDIKSYGGKRLGDIATNISSGVTPRSGSNAYISQQEGGIPFIRSGEITDDCSVEKKQALFIKSEIHNGLMKKSKLKTGDLLIAIVGATIGSVGIYNRPEEANINQAIAAVRFKDKSIDPFYIAVFLKTVIGQNVLNAISRPVARANINLEEISQLLIPLPPPKEQNRIAQEAQARLERAKKLKQEALKELQQAKAHVEKIILGEAE